MMMSTPMLQETQEGGVSATTNTIHGHTRKRSSPSLALYEPCLKKPRIDQCFNKVTLPIPFPSPTSTTTLRRTISDPIYSFGTMNTPFAKNNLVTSSPISPPSASHSRGLLRSLSDPTTFTFGSTIKPEPLIASQRSLEKRKEISQMCSQVIPEEEEEEEEEEDDNINIQNKRVCDWDLEDLDVEENEDCLVVHFNCPCGKGYQILLSGNNCYYKLT